MKIKTPTAAGKFYTNNKDDLSNQIDFFIESSKKTSGYSSRAVIVPHAGYVFSGELAVKGLLYLNKEVENIFIIAPPHYVPVKDIAISSYNFWSTPLGKIEVNQNINKILAEKFGAKFQDEALENEHSVEVQIPLIQKIFPEVKIIPILAANPDKLTEIINYFWENPKNAFVISSDLSHFLTSNEAKSLDEITAEMIENKMADNMVSEQACGSCGIKGLINFAKLKKFSLIRLGMHNSSETTGDVRSVVGYGSWFLYEGAKNSFIKKCYSNLVIELCKKSILSRFEAQEFKAANVPAVFEQKGASFVTLEKNGDLRGCIGSIIAHRPLVRDLINNSQQSAFSDPRFPPLKLYEFDELSINVSLLSEPEKVDFLDEQDLLSQIEPFVDGLIIKDGGYQSVYLPSVWEDLPDKELFLKSLKIKAGMLPEHFSKTFEAFKFNTEYIKC